MTAEVGRPAPDFTLADPEGRDVTLSGFRGEREVVLVFYPGAFSEICTAQLSDVGAREDRFARAGAQVLGVSVDSRYCQGRFARDLGLTRTILLADFHPKGEVARRYGVWMDAFGVAARATFVIDRDGVLRAAHLTEHPGQTPDPDDYLRSLAACRAPAPEPRAS